MSTPHPMTLEDLWALKTLGNVAVSPDGLRVAFVLHKSDKEKNERSSAIWLLHLNQQGQAVGEARQLTSGLKNDTNPVWATDSHRLLFLSDREDGKNQLWLLDTDGGEARKLTGMLHGVSDAACSPDGKWIAFTAPVAANDEDDVLIGRKTLDDATKKQREEDERFRLRTVTEIWYRVDGRGLLEQFDQLFVMPMPVADENIDFATIRRLTSGAFDHTQPLWTPDSSEIGLLYNANEARRHSFISDLWAIGRESGAARCLTDGTLEIECYAWSPDGRAAVIVGAKDQIIYGRSHQRLYLVTRYGNVGDRILPLTPDLDSETFPIVGGSFGFPGIYRPQWSADGQQLYFLVAERGCAHVYAMNIVWRSLSRLTSGNSVTSALFLLPQGRGLLLAREVPEHFWELYRLPVHDGAQTAMEEPERLTHLYDRVLADLQLGKVERLRYQGANGDEIDGWLISPVGARAGVRYPLLVHIHGGPHWGYSIGLDPLFHYYAAQGFAVFYCNPHGSTSCGEAFMREVIGDWGGWDYQDIMLGVDECIARGVADPERLVVTGYSYGGYMSMFTIGQTDRFKAAVPMAGISNLASFVGTSDIGFWQAAEAKGYPWEPERADYFRERSPLTYAPRVTTPTLFLHPENDLRCPIEQSEQFYMTLKMLGKVPVTFVRVPAAWHGGTTKPAQEMAYTEILLDWFRKYIEIRPEDYA